jgi:hypothetical protein
MGTRLQGTDMRKFDRAVLLALTAGIWALVALQLVHPATADTRLADMPLQGVFNQYLTTALSQARSAANGCRIKGEIHGAILDARINC